MKLSWLLLVPELSLARAAEIARLTGGCLASRPKPVLNAGLLFTCSLACTAGTLFVWAMSSTVAMQCGAYYNTCPCTLPSPSTTLNHVMHLLLRPYVMYTSLYPLMSFQLKA